MTPVFFEAVLEEYLRTWKRLILRICVGESTTDEGTSSIANLADADAAQFGFREQRPKSADRGRDVANLATSRPRSTSVDVSSLASGGGGEPSWMNRRESIATVPLRGLNPHEFTRRASRCISSPDCAPPQQPHLTLEGHASWGNKPPAESPLGGGSPRDHLHHLSGDLLSSAAPRDNLSRGGSSARRGDLHNVSVSNRGSAPRANLSRQETGTLFSLDHQEQDLIQVRCSIVGLGSRWIGEFIFLRLRTSLGTTFPELVPRRARRAY